jgi:predicted HAD superfamily phosphohydrolase YqeG
MVEVNLKPGIKVVILDSFSTLCQSEERENDSGSWAGMQEWLLTLRSQGFTVLLVHHDEPEHSKRWSEVSG